jgi:hypothetical protein
MAVVGWKGEKHLPRGEAPAVPREKRYEASVAWDGSRPDTLIVCCSDGRWSAAIQEFAVRHLGTHTHADIVSVPGGIEPLTLVDLVPKDFNFLRRRLEALVAGHGTTRIVAIAHEDCSWYRVHKIGPVTLDLRARQVADLARATARLCELFPQVAVETYYASRSAGPPERIVFEEVGRPPHA